MYPIATAICSCDINQSKKILLPIFLLFLWLFLDLIIMSEQALDYTEFADPRTRHLQSLEGVPPIIFNGKDRVQKEKITASCLLTRIL